MSALGWHVLRGAAAVALLVAGFSPGWPSPWPALLSLPLAAVLLRGCPMCWLLGLAERLRALPNRSH